MRENMYKRTQFKIDYVFVRIKRALTLRFGKNFTVIKFFKNRIGYTEY